MRKRVWIGFEGTEERGYKLVYIKGRKDKREGYLFWLDFTLGVRLFFKNFRE